MLITKDFTVNAPLNQVWPVLLDIPRVARCLPGATLESSGDGQVYRGQVSVKLGPIQTTYSGTAQIQDIDEESHVITFALDARETGGQGLAKAELVSRIVRHGEQSQVSVEMDLNIAGAHAQFGRGMLESVAESIIEQFVHQLEKEVAVDESERSDTVRAGASAEHPAPSAVSNESRVAEGAQNRGGSSDALDLGSLAFGMLSRHRVLGASFASLSLLMLAIYARRVSSKSDRGIRITITYRR